MMNLTNKPVKQGLASYDEMCDLYLMYWALAGKTDKTHEENLLQGPNFCWSPGPPDVTWSSLGLNNIPNAITSSFS